MSVREELKSMGACSEAVDWAESYATLQEAWDACERGDWMLWLAGKHSGPPGSVKRRTLVLAAAECARLGWPYVHDQDREVVETCYRVSEAWGRNDPSVSIQNVKAAAADAVAAADAAAAACAYAAYAADVDDAAFAANAAAFAAAFAARGEKLRLASGIVRRHYPKVPSDD